MRNFNNILAWQKSDDLTVAVYDATRDFPREEIYSLTSQMRRSAYSVPANIAEGASRSSKKDYLHFLYIARGSLSELAYFIHLSKRLRYLPDSDHDQLAGQADEASRVLTGLIKSVEKEAGLVARTLAKTSALIFLFFSLKSQVSGL
ncbi:MAG TPA: four helix bundle protein [Kiritimatiellia bacterium]|nr:four helix bundle protein [Kiritimatiellia bacterium]HMO98698.1 four helix bundle protein [Kiritimatiellia bacterium]HMP90885.1 four helix bundle protein [Kiritimatiellia bacterium]